jgi:tetratricopeptide (TPR) repeat protein
MADKDKRGRAGKGASPVNPEATEEDEEIARYREILARESSSLVFAALAEAYRKRSLLDQAIAVCRKGLYHHPEFVSGRVALARAYVDKGETDRAVRELERVVDAAPDNRLAQGLLLTLYERKGDRDNLEKTVHRILSVDSSDERARRCWETLSMQPGSEVKTDPEGKRPGEIVTQTLADIYASQGYHEKAFEIYRKLCMQEPGNPAFHRRLAELKQRILQRGRAPERDRHPEDLAPGAQTNECRRIDSGRP